MASGTELCLPLDLIEQPEAVYGQKVGYARVSSKDQNLARQEELLRKEGVYSARPGVLSEDEVVRVRELVELGVPKAEVARRFRVSRTTIFRAMQDNYRPRRTGDKKK